MLSKKLDTPPLESIREVFQNGLTKTFFQVSVEVVDCPDLTQEPFNLACRGLGGKRVIVEIGGPPYLLPVVNRDKVYNMTDVAKDIGMNPCFIIGAGAGPWPYVGKNCEMMANLYIEGDKVLSRTHIAKVKDDGTSNIEVKVMPNSETKCALLANLFYCEGSPSKVLRVSAKTRIGSDNFVSALRTLLADNFTGQQIGVGGAFVIKSGKVRQHVMPDFSSSRLTNEAQLNQWLTFHEMSAPLVAVGTFMSSDIPNFDLRVQHFHSFSSHGEGGHYHEDTTPEEVEYLGYFNLGEKIYRIDKPQQTHTWGRD